MIKNIIVFILAFYIVQSHAVESSIISNTPIKNKYFPSSIYTNYNSPLKIYKRNWGPDFMAGLESGINISNINEPVGSTTNIKVGFYTGAFVRVEYTETISVQSGLYYTVVGYKKETSYSKNSDEYVTDKFSMNLAYIKLPLLYRITFGEKIKMNIESGAYASLLLSAKQIGTKTTETDIIVTGDTNVDAYDNFTKADFGISISTGIEYPLTNNRRGINYKTFFKVGYDIGMLNVSTANLGTLKNRNIYSGIGLILLFD